MEYKGYYIAVRWNNKELGFDFMVYDPEHRQVARSSEAYFSIIMQKKGRKRLLIRFSRRKKSADKIHNFPRTSLCILFP